MPQQAKGIRLYQHPSRKIWLIRDSKRGQSSTGTRDRDEAEKSLAQYIVEQGESPRRSAPDKLSVSEALEIYCEQHAPNVADPQRIFYGASTLLSHSIGKLRANEITSGACRRYERERNRAPGTIRRELGTLQAALNYAAGEGYLVAAPKVKMPPAPPPRDRWLTAAEVDALIRAAECDPRTEHLARFIQIGVLTGTRSKAILGLRFMRHTQGGWIDTERGILYRRADGQLETKKRQPPIKLPRQLLVAVRVWEREGEPGGWVVNYSGPGAGIAARGQRVVSIKTAWRTVLKRSGIDHARPHDLRHTCATWLMQAGANVWDAAGFLGMSVDMLQKTYGHHHPDHMETAVQAMEAHNVTDSLQLQHVGTVCNDSRSQ